MRLSIFDYPWGVETAGQLDVTYDVKHDAAFLGPVQIEGHALVWRTDAPVSDAALLTAEFELDPAVDWTMRCDRVDFPPGATAYLHTHTDPGVRCTIMGWIQIDTRGDSKVHRAFEPWFETGPDPVYAPAAEDRHSAFVRVLFAPAEWAGKRTIHHLDSADAARARQTARVYFEVPFRTSAEHDLVQGHADALRRGGS